MHAEDAESDKESLDAKFDKLNEGVLDDDSLHINDVFEFHDKIEALQYQNKVNI